MRTPGQKVRGRGLARAASWVLARCAVLTVCVLTLAGCGIAVRHAASGPGPDTATGPVIPAGSSSHAIDVGGVRRTFIVYRPASLPAAAPLVVMLHGGFGTRPARREKSYGWDAEADRGHFVVAYPDGLDRAWNTGGGCCGTPGRTERRRHRVHHRDGVSHRARRSRSTPAASTPPASATAASWPTRWPATRRSSRPSGPTPPPNWAAVPPRRPLSVIHIHGTADKNIPYQGGEGDGVAHIDGPPVPSLVARWRGIDHCAAPATRPPRWSPPRPRPARAGGRSN